MAKYEAQVVGWSDFVHDLHGAARVSNAQWREANRPREYALFDEMNKSRRLFKAALIEGVDRIEHVLKVLSWPQPC